MTEADINDDPAIEIRVQKAKKLVHALATGTNRIDGKLAIFGMEERAVHLVLAALDAEGNGQLTDEERNKYEEVGQKLVDRTMQMCLNSLVVAALLISMFTPYAFEDLLVSEKAEEYFSERFQIMYPPIKFIGKLKNTTALRHFTSHHANIMLVHICSM